MSKILPHNVHTIERGARVALGIGLLSLLFVGPVPGWGLVGLLGAILVATGAYGSCPIFTILGVSTCKVPATRS